MSFTFKETEGRRAARKVATLQELKLRKVWRENFPNPCGFLG